MATTTLTPRHIAPTALIIAWATLHVGLLAVILAHPGQLALRDMLVLDHPALTADALGWGDLPGRATPQDAVLALVGRVLPASWFARGLLIAGASAGAGGAVTLARHCGGRTAASCAAISLTLANPGVIERLLQGHWSLVIAVWLLPLITWAGLRGHTATQWLGLWAAALSPTGALMATAIGVAAARGRARLYTLGIGAGLTLVWAVPALLGHADAPSHATEAAIRAFAPRAAAGATTPGTLVGLGGIWNAQAQPASQDHGWAILGILIALTIVPGMARLPARLRPVLALGAGGVAVGILAWAAPGTMAQLAAWLPGSGLLRDSHKWALLALPALVAALGQLRGRILPWAVAACCALHVPDAASALRQLTPVPVTAPTPPCPGELLLTGPGSDTLVTRPDGAPMINPWTKAAPILASGQLRVDGQLIDAPAPRFHHAQHAWAEGDLDRLADLGVSCVVRASDGAVLARPGAPAHPTPKAGYALLALWAGLVPAAYLALTRALRRSSQAAPVSRQE
ncbi:hypothetical protein LH392_11150 [Corynebacterium uberis]|uniref:hypothetical protein n=1 Tax=Corynebacterium uberis TaxID=2883169 RepID=UPI001D0B5BC6|nr:hypothetical protein [Corynebacterium uberis]UDL80185.1 hypothetical protein LH392_11150 [Corynebacterium uberis]